MPCFAVKGANARYAELSSATFIAVYSIRSGDARFLRVIREFINKNLKSRIVIYYFLRFDNKIEPEKHWLHTRRFVIKSAACCEIAA